MRGNSGTGQKNEMTNTSGNKQTGLRDWLVAIVLLEGVCLAIGLLMPITPSKTGDHTSWSPASLVKQDPSYLESAAAWFLFTNIAFVLIGLIVYVVVIRRRA